MFSTLKYAYQTVAALSIFVLAMVFHPDAYSKAQQEVDRVVGRERLPGYSDRDSLPYVQSLLLESLRYVPGLAGFV